MNKLKINFNIPSLIVKSFQQELNKSEKEQLNEWINDDENQSLYERLKNIDDLEERKLFIRQLNKSQAWKNVNKSIQPAKTKTFSTCLRYAAIFILPIAVAASLLFYFNPNDIIKSQQLEINIPPGYSKATLKMADGTLIDLESKKFKNFKDLDGTLITNDSKTLSFKIEKRTTNVSPPIMRDIIIPRTGEYHTILPDGTEVWLNSETVLEIPSRFSGKERNVRLKKGEAFFQVAHDAKHPFVVTTKKSVVKVLGTSFNIRAYENEIENLTTLVDGSIDLRHRYDKNSTVNLRQGEQASIITVNRKIKINNVETQYYTAWKDGRFAFLNERLDNIMKRLERWYDIEIDFIDEETKAFRFTGNLPRYENISHILKMLQDVYSKIDFNVKDNKLIVKKK